MYILDPTQARALAEKILTNIGGVENLATGEPELTRLKLTLLDPKKLNESELLAGEEELLIGVLNRVEAENAIYLVTNKIRIATELWSEISRLKVEALKNAEKTS